MRLKVTQCPMMKLSGRRSLKNARRLASRNGRCFRPGSRLNKRSANGSIGIQRLILRLSPVASPTWWYSIWTLMMPFGMPAKGAGFQIPRKQRQGKVTIYICGIQALKSEIKLTRTLRSISGLTAVMWQHRHRCMAPVVSINGKMVFQFSISTRHPVSSG